MAVNNELVVKRTVSSEASADVHATFVFKIGESIEGTYRNDNALSARQRVLLGS